MFANKNKLDQHEKMHTPGFNEKFECQQCDYKAGREGTIRKHIRFVHNKERPLQCEECAQVFACTNTLNRHKTVFHIKEKPFACEV